MATGAAVVLALGVVGAAVFTVARWWEQRRDADEVRLVPVPRESFDPVPSSLSVVVDLPGGPAFVGGSDCAVVASDGGCSWGWVVWMERDERWAGQPLLLPTDLEGVSVRGAAASDDRVLVFGEGRGDGGAFGASVPVLWRGASVDDLVMERAPTTVGEVICERSRSIPDTGCADVTVLAAAETPRGSLLVTQQGTGRGTIGLYRRADNGWHQLPVAPSLSTVDAVATGGGRLILAGGLCPGCPARPDLEPGLLTTEDGTHWEREGVGAFPTTPVAGLAGSRDGAVAAFEVEERRCRLAHSADGRSWRLLTGLRGCSGELRLATGGGLIAVAERRGQTVDVMAVDGQSMDTVSLPPGARLDLLAGAGGRILLTAHAEDHHVPMVFEIVGREGH